MLKTEIYAEVEGMTLIRTWDDGGNYIRQDETGNLYAEAVDPDFMNRSYTETDIPIETFEEPEEGEIPEEVGVPEEVTEDAEPEDADGSVSVPEELV